jgi:RNA polymerase sigma factor (sigma-70 family)
MEAATKERVTTRQLKEAERGLIRLLHAKRFPREWIERHAPDVMAQARLDFAARLAAGREDDTINLLVVIAYRRAMKVLTVERARPANTSIDGVFHLADESTPSPEDEAIDQDRQERVVKAMAVLPDRDRKLLALVYFEGMSVREAGRRLGWGKSSADRHHQAALDRLKALLDRSLLSPEIAIPAYIATRSASPPNAVLIWFEGAAETTRNGLLAISGRLSPVGEAGSAAAVSGAGRTAAGVCGAAVVACLTGAATGVVGPGIGGLATHDHNAHVRQAAEPSRHEAVARPITPPEPTLDPAAPGEPLGGSGPAAHQSRTRHGAMSPAASKPLGHAKIPESRPAPAAAQPTVDEFGIEGASSPTPIETEGSSAAQLSDPASRPQTKSPPPPAEAIEPSKSGAEFGM